MAKFDENHIFNYVINKNITQVQNYIKYGYDINVIFNQKIHFIDFANIKPGNLEYYVKDLKEKTNWTPLCFALYHDYYSISLLLLNNGADVNITCKYYWPVNANPIHLVTSHRNKILYHVIEKGANIDVLNTKDYADEKKYEKAKQLKRKALLTKLTNLIEE